MGDTGGLQQAKLVLLGDMGAGKSSLVLRFVKGQFFDYQVRQDLTHSSLSGSLPQHYSCSAYGIKFLTSCSGIDHWSCLPYKDNARAKCKV